MPLQARPGKTIRKKLGQPGCAVVPCRAPGASHWRARNEPCAAQRRRAAAAMHRSARFCRARPDPSRISPACSQFPPRSRSHLAVAPRQRHLHGQGRARPPRRRRRPVPEPKRTGRPRTANNVWKLGILAPHSRLPPKLRRSRAAAARPTPPGSTKPPGLHGRKAPPRGGGAAAPGRRQQRAAAAGQPTKPVVKQQGSCDFRRSGQAYRTSFPPGDPATGRFHGRKRRRLERQRPNGEE